MKPVPSAAATLSVVAAICAAAASVTTLLWSGAFPLPAAALGAVNGALAEARGWSAITLCTAVPITALGLRAARRGSLRGRLAWLGALAYLVYTYLEMAVSPPFTALYLVYIGAFACALPALIMGVASVDATMVAETLGARAPRRGLIAFGMAIAILLSLAWLKDIASRTAAGTFGWPTGEDAIGHVVHALDLGLQVPLALATALLLGRRRPSGYVAAAILLVNSSCMGLALVAMVAAHARAAGENVLQAAPFAVVPLAALVLAARFFRAPAAPPD